MTRVMKGVWGKKTRGDEWRIVEIKKAREEESVLYLRLGVEIE